MSNASKRNERIDETTYNNQGCLMRIIEYYKNKDIIIEFQDEYKARVHTQYSNFLQGNVKNPYHKSVFNVGMVGVKYPISSNYKHTKEYNSWKGVLERCYDNTYKEKEPTYKDVMCCEEWLLFENFYEWLHSQSNFDKWFNGNQWAIDKDILNKENKIYGSDFCCLVPQCVNNLFITHNTRRGSEYIGVIKQNNRYIALCSNPFTKKQEYLGMYITQQEAFLAYKQCKECYIKQVAEIEYAKGNITKRCYDAMMDYEVEITD
jgi:hypothetical protein